MKYFNNILFALLFLIITPYAYSTGLLQCVSTGTAPGSIALVHPQKMKVETVIRDQIATTVVQEEFRQTSGERVRAEYGFPAPVDATISGVRLWINGIESKLVISTTPADTTASGGGVIAKTPMQKAFTSAGYKETILSLPIANEISKNSIVTVEISYIEILPYSLGLSSYVYPLKTLADCPALLDSAHFRDFIIMVRLETGMNLDTAWSPSHLSTDCRIELSNAGIQIELAGGRKGYSQVQQDFELKFRVSQADIKNAFFSSKPSNEDGHFLFVLRPKPDAQSTEILPKMFTFIMDISGSMVGTKLRQAKDAALYCIKNLNPTDSFNVILFDDQVHYWSTKVVVASRSNIDQACDYIEYSNVGGGTDIEKASLAGLSQYRNPKSVNVMVLLTDGIAPIDQTKIQKANTNNVRINVFGVGTDVNQQQLAQLGALNQGYVRFVTETQNTLAEIQAFYSKIRYPVWSNVSVSFDGGDTYDVLPAVLPDLNFGEQLNISGRYKTPGNGNITVKGIAGGQPFERVYPVTYTGDSTVDVFCPKIWARMRIQYLQTLMAQETPNSSRWTEWKNEIIRLGQRYSIVTTFTTYKDTGTISFVELSDPESLRSEAAAYPNPFAKTTTISYRVYEPAPIRISIFDLQGREIALLLESDNAERGDYTISWDGIDTFGNQLPAGVYLCSIRIGTTERVLHLTITR